MQNYNFVPDFKIIACKIKTQTKIFVKPKIHIKSLTIGLPKILIKALKPQTLASIELQTLTPWNKSWINEIAR